MSILFLYSRPSASSPSTSSLATNSGSVLDAPIPSDEQLPDIDDEIKKRLEMVKQPTNDLDKEFSDKSIAERLSNLKGIPHQEYDHRAMLNAVDKRSETQKANDLVEQFMKEVSLDEAAKEDFEDPIKSIERRLAALKGPTTPTHANNGLDSPPEPQNEDDIVKKIVTKVRYQHHLHQILMLKLTQRARDHLMTSICFQYLDEAKLPDSDLTPEEKEFVNSCKPEEGHEELPWCCICNEDATIRCVGCDGDLFCKPCFNEIHANDEEYREHETKRYVPKQTQPQ